MEEASKPVTISELSHFYSLNITTVNQYKDSLGSTYIRMIMNILNWKGSSQSLLERVMLMFRNPFKLSVREFKMLRKTYYQKVNAGLIDWEEIVNIFPEKDPEFIIQTCQSLPGKGVIPKTNTLHFEYGGFRLASIPNESAMNRKNTLESKLELKSLDATFYS